MKTIQGNTTKNGLIVGNLQGELADLVVRKYHEEFRGTRADFDTSVKEGEFLRHSNTIFNNFANVLLRQELGDSTHVLTAEEFVQHWDNIPDKSSTYADTCGIAIFPNKGPNEEHRQRVFGIIGKASTSIPLIVYGLKPVRCGNEDGFQFKGSEYIVTKEAPFLQNDGTVKYDQSINGLVSSGKGVSVWTPSSQTGLRRVYRVGNDFLLVADSGGRVQILQDPKGLVTKISDRYTRVLSEIQGLPEDMKEAIAHYARNDPSVLEKLM